MSDKTPYNQPTNAPTRKMSMVAVGGGVASVLMGAMSIFYPEQYALVPAGFEGGVATLAAFLLGYIVRERV